MANLQQLTLSLVFGRTTGAEGAGVVVQRCSPVQVRARHPMGVPRLEPWNDKRIPKPERFWRPCWVLWMILITGSGVVKSKRELLSNVSETPEEQQRFRARLRRDSGHRRDLCLRWHRQPRWRCRWMP